MKPILVIIGIVLAATGGVIAYRALFLEPSAAVVIGGLGRIVCISAAPRKTAGPRTAGRGSGSAGTRRRHG